MTRHLRLLPLLLLLTLPATAQENQPTVTHTARIETSRGVIEVELYGADAPKTVANFVGLAAKGVYDSILVHRVRPDFVIQMGDPKTRDSSQRDQWGRGGVSIYDDKPFEDELREETPSYKRGYVEGTLAMANRGPNTNSSQFFILAEDKDDLPHRYTIFGRVTRGMDIVTAINEVEIDSKDRPVVPVVVYTVKTTEKGGAEK